MLPLYGAKRHDLTGIVRKSTSRSTKGVGSGRRSLTRPKPEQLNKLCGKLELEEDPMVVVNPLKYSTYWSPQIRRDALLIPI